MAAPLSTDSSNRCNTRQAGDAKIRYRHLTLRAGLGKHDYVLSLVHQALNLEAFHHEPSRRRFLLPLH